MRHMTPEDFEARYRAEGDPWSYETSEYERAKYDATLAACAPGPYGHALELGSSIGVLSARLSERCRHLDTVDLAPTAVAAARRRLAARPGVRVILGVIPDAIPRQSYDLVLASEILYYLTPAVLDQTLESLAERTSPGARLVAVHWRPPGPERPLSAEEVHARLRTTAWLTPLENASTEDYLLDVLQCT